MLQYYFKQEDYRLHDVAESMGFLPYLKKVVQGNKIKIEKKFEDMLEEMKKEPENEARKKFIEEMNFNQFNDVVEFTFVVMFSQGLLKLVEEGKDIEQVFIMSYNLAEKMSNDHSSIYAKMIDQAIGCCYNGIILTYANIK